jgi:putative addiction module killer protein
MAKYEIWRYRAANDRIPITDWVRSLRDAMAQVAIDRRILRMELGNFGDHKYCRDGVWEMRVDVGPGYRVYYAVTGAEIILLLCGGDKRTQSADIGRAVQYWAEWQRRTNDERSAK